MKKSGFTLVGLSVIVALVLICILLATWATPKLSAPENAWRTSMAEAVAALISEGSLANAALCKQKGVGDPKCIRFNSRIPARESACDAAALSKFLDEKTVLTPFFPTKENEFMVEGAASCERAETRVSCTLRPYPGDYAGAAPVAVSFPIYCTD